MAWIRQARAEDAGRIARVHWESWETTYRGVLPDAVLDERTVEVRRAFWEQLLSDEATVSGVLVSCSEEGAIEGFVACGRERSSTLGVEGEVYAIYMRREWQGRGHGRGVMAAAAERLRELGCSSLGLWVLAANPAVKFYERMGGRVIARRMELFGGREFEELAMGWDPIDHLRP